MIVKIEWFSHQEQNYSPKCNRRNQRHQSKCCKTLHVEHKSIQQQHKNQMSILFQLYFSRPLLQDMKGQNKNSWCIQQNLHLGFAREMWASFPIHSISALQHFLHKFLFDGTDEKKKFWKRYNYDLSSI